MSKHTFNKNDAIEIANKLYEQHYKDYGGNIPKYNVITAKKSLMEADCWIVMYEYVSDLGEWGTFSMHILVNGNGVASILW